MDRNEYNGWTNRATWLVNVWFNPESSDDVESARYAIEAAEDALPDFMRDFLCTDDINDALEWKTRARNAEHACREAYRLLVDPDTALSARDLESMLYDVLKKAGKT